MKNMVLFAFALLLFTIIFSVLVSAAYNYNHPYYQGHTQVYKRTVVNDNPYTTVEYINRNYYRGPEIYYSSYNRIPNYKLYYSPHYSSYNKPYHNSYYNRYPYDNYRVRSIKYYSPYENRKYRSVDKHNNRIKRRY